MLETEGTSKSQFDHDWSCVVTVPYQFTTQGHCCTRLTVFQHVTRENGLNMRWDRGSQQCPPSVMRSWNQINRCCNTACWCRSKNKCMNKQKTKDSKEPMRDHFNAEICWEWKVHHALWPNNMSHLRKGNGLSNKASFPTLPPSSPPLAPPTTGRLASASFVPFFSLSLLLCVCLIINASTTGASTTTAVTDRSHSKRRQRKVKQRHLLQQRSELLIMATQQKKTLKIVILGDSGWVNAVSWPY